jgi:2-hydroxycyclohexanecarboxyl-CoA dehydrogenase
MRLAGSTAIVTGGAGEIGAAVVMTLAAQGARVAVADIDEDRGRRVAQQGGAGAERAFVRADMTSPERVNSAVAEVADMWGPVDIAVNVVGWTLSTPFLEEQPAYWRRVVDLNLMSAVYLSGAVLPGMVASGSGRIVFVSSLAGRIGRRDKALYSASKSGLIGLAKALALDFASHDITINCVAPGATDTAQMRGQGDSYTAYALRNIPRGRFATPQDQANAVAFLASPEAAHITGQTLAVDGGATMVLPRSSQALRLDARVDAIERQARQLISDLRRRESTVSPEPLVNPICHSENAHRDDLRVEVAMELPAFLAPDKDRAHHLVIAVTFFNDGEAPLIAQGPEVIEKDLQQDEVLGNEADVPAHKLPQLLARREIVHPRDFLKEGKETAVAPHDDLEKQIFFRVHVVVDAALEDAKLVGDVLHRGGVVALAVKELRSRLYDLFFARARLLGAAPAAGGRLCRRHRNLSVCPASQMDVMISPCLLPGQQFCYQANNLANG